jgi:endoglucanase
MLDFSVRRASSVAALVTLFSACGGGKYMYSAPPCKAGELTTDGGCISDPRKISFDSVGYLPSHAKAATLVALDTFAIKRADGSVALDGNATGPLAADTGESVKIADFTSVTEPGEYYIEATGADGTLSSPHFRIGADAYDDALRTLMIGMYGQRCGTAVHIDFAGQPFTHGACHLNDAYTDKLDGKNAIRPSLLGWHDAGDYGKYVTNGAFSVGVFFKAWEHFPAALTRLSLPIPEHGGALPDFLAEMKFELDWLLTTQLEDGSVSHKVTALMFEPGVAPEADGSQRYYAPIGTAATAEVAAVMAMAARIFAPYDQAYADTCLQAAKRSYGYLQAHPSRQRPDLSAFSTGAYQLNDDAGPRLWAAAEIFETTGDPAALAEVQTRIRARPLVMAKRPPPLVDSDWDWGTPANLGIFTYLLSSRDGRDLSLVQQVKTKNQQNADDLARASESSGYGRTNIGYYWGANGSVARISMNLQIAYRFTGDQRYLDAALRQIDHLFGRNYYARSQVTGVGIKPPLYPHHRPSMTTGRAWPGLLVGGGNPGPTDWVDIQGMYEQNEVALNWNAALVYALAGFASGTSEGTGFYAGPPLGDSMDGGMPSMDAGAPSIDAPEVGPSPEDASALDAEPDVDPSDALADETIGD